MVKIQGFREDFQTHKLTGQKDTLWIIENIPGTLKQGVSSYHRRDQDARIDERANQCASSLPHLRRCWVISLSISSQSNKGRPLARIFWRTANSFLPKGVRAVRFVVDVGTFVCVSIAHLL
jgi:hypothetical protein